MIARATATEPWPVTPSPQRFLINEPLRFTASKAFRFSNRITGITNRVTTVQLAPTTSPASRPPSFSFSTISWINIPTPAARMLKSTICGKRARASWKPSRIEEGLSSSFCIATAMTVAPASEPGSPATNKTGKTHRIPGHRKSEACGVLEKAAKKRPKNTAI